MRRFERGKERWMAWKCVLQERYDRGDAEGFVESGPKRRMRGALENDRPDAFRRAFSRRGRKYSRMEVSAKPPPGICYPYG